MCTTAADNPFTASFLQKHGCPQTRELPEDPSPLCRSHTLTIRLAPSCHPHLLLSKLPKFKDSWGRGGNKCVNNTQSNAKIMHNQSIRNVGKMQKVAKSCHISWRTLCHVVGCDDDFLLVHNVHELVKSHVPNPWNLAQQQYSCNPGSQQCSWRSKHSSRSSTDISYTAARQTGSSAHKASHVAESQYQATSTRTS